MGTWKMWRLVILAAVLAGFAWTLVNRSPIGRSSAETASIKTTYKTEHEWAIRETAIDIEKMAAFANKRDARPPGQQLPEVPWEPDAFSVLAAGAFGEAAPAAAELQADLYPALTAMDVAALVDAGRTVSQALERNMRDPRAHESAALVIGAFALRDAADQFTDVRWALNRMTAHLAVARTLRPNGGGSPDGALAQVLLSTLANQQARAATQLAALGTGAPPEPMNAWLRALSIRITQDWRALPDPAAATRLEKLEYFRARRATVRRRRAAEDLATVGEPVAADFARLAQDGQVGVEDDHDFVAPALELELAEAGVAYERLHGRPMPDALPEALNHRASYLVDTTPVVLPWGAWAEFFQRHIAMNMGMVDSYYRLHLGDREQADQTKRDLSQRIGKLTSFPLGTMRWTKGNNATEADLTYLPRVVELAETAPELISQRAWAFFALGSRYESIPVSMPKLQPWFAGATAAVPFEAGVRHAAGLRAQAADLPALFEAAPTDRALMISATAGGGTGPAVAHARALLQARHDFDLGAIDASLAHEKDDAVRAAFLRKACALSSRDCLALARTLTLVGNEAEAAAEYERALADPMMDGVARAADSGWLVDYYRRNGQVDQALALADQAAGVGSRPGYEIRGRLRERLGQFDGAEEDFGAVATRYDNSEALLGFYYRRVEVAKDAAYQHKWKKWLAETFPNGLQPEPVSMPAKPTSGVFVYADSERSRKVGIRAGDIIVGLEGWRVDNFEQYRAINGFFDHPRVKLTLWRGSLIKIDADAPSRLFGTDIRTHPLKGWIE